MPTVSSLATKMKPNISFADMYGLALIAKKPEGVDRLEIVKHLSSLEALQIANALISPTRTPSEVEATTDLTRTATQTSGSDSDQRSDPSRQ